MTVIIERSRRPRLWANLLFPVAAVVVGNALIFATGANQGGDLSASQQAMLPPGPVIGAAWTFLFATMGLSRWLVLRERGPGWWGWLPIGLMLLGLAFPLYTNGLSDTAAGAAGTVVTLIYTVITMFALRSQAAAVALLPSACWLGFVASVYFLA